jgi:hypothetical protein
VSWVFKHAGTSLPAIDRPYGFVNCADAMTYAKAHGLWDDSGRYRPGDIVIFGGGEHTGIVVQDDGAVLHTIEGNTSPGQAGPQTNGGGVYAKARSHNDWVNGVFTASRLLDSSASTDQPQPKGALALDGQLGRGQAEPHAGRATRLSGRLSATWMRTRP